VTQRYSCPSSYFSNTPRRPVSGCTYSSTHSLPRHSDAGEWSASLHSHSTPRRSHRHLPDMRLGVTRSRTGHSGEEKGLLPLLGSTNWDISSIMNGESVWIWANSTISFQQTILRNLLEISNKGLFITVCRPKLLICANPSVFSHEDVTLLLNFKIIMTLQTQIPWKMLKYDCKRFACSNLILDLPSMKNDSMRV
jgi:hypothetical protein